MNLIQNGYKNSSFNIMYFMLSSNIKHIHDRESLAKVLILIHVRNSLDQLVTVHNEDNPTSALVVLPGLGFEKRVTTKRPFATLKALRFFVGMFHPLLQSRLVR